MSYIRVNWIESETPLSADNMNNIEDGIEEALAGLNINSLRSKLLNVFYPVGCYLETSNKNYNPNSALGGTWVLEESGKVHIGAGTGYPIGSTGGNKDAIVPYHRHNIAAHNTESSGSCTTGAMSANSSITGSVSTRRPVSDGWDLLWGASGVFSTSDISESSTMDGTATRRAKGQKLSLSKSIAHTHSVPKHTHSIAANNTGYVGTSGNTTNANMQPYIVVNRWHRTA